MTVPTPSPLGSCQVLGRNGWSQPEKLKSLSDFQAALADGSILDLSRSDVESVFNTRLPSGERLDAVIVKRPKALPTSTERRHLWKLWFPRVSLVSGSQLVLKELLRQEWKVIGCFQKIWKAVDTSLCLAFREETKEITCFKVKWWKILCRLVLRHKSVHYAGKMWKEYTKYLLLHFGGALSPLPVWQEYWPRHPRDTWLAKLPRSLTDEERTRWSCLISTRGLPAGDHVTADKALDKHAEALCAKADLSVQDLETLDHYSRVAAGMVKDHIPSSFWQTKSGHISISNTSCLEATRSEGGRRQYVLDHLHSWLESSPDQDRQTILPTGETVVETKGVDRRFTVKPPLMAKPCGERVKLQSGLCTEDFPETEQERVSFQLFAWSFITLLEDGYIDKYGYPTGKPLPIERIAIGEPGIKCRIATKSLAAFVTYGQPFGHLLKDILYHDPQLRAGLGAGSQLYEWLKPFDGGKLPDYIMVGDFESATDNIDHVGGRVAMHAFFDELGITSDYVRGYLEVLLGPRIFEIHAGITAVSSTGSLMGEPGTKGVLTFLAKVANVYAWDGLSSPHFATAGDDQIDASNNSETLLRYAEASRITTMIPSEDKWGVFEHSTVYCQQGVHCGRSAKFAEIAAPKVRLLSPETKTGRGDADTNPAYGKARQLGVEISWHSPESPELCACFVALFLRNMAQYINIEPELFLPTEWGGLGLPLVQAPAIWPRLPDWKKQLIIRREQGSDVAKRLLARWSSSRNFERGIVPSEHSAEEAYTEFFKENLPVVLDHREVLPDTPNLRFREVVKEMEKHGFLTLSSLIQKVITASQYQNFWDPSSRPDRGFKTLSWRERNRRMLKAFNEFFPCNDEINISSSPKAPQWYPEVFLKVDGLYPHYLEGTARALETAKLVREEGEVEVVQHKVLGPGLNGPRVFLYTCNDRLARYVGRSLRHKSKRTFIDNLLRTNRVPLSESPLRESPKKRRRLF